MKVLYGVIGVILCIISPIFTLIDNEHHRKPGYVSVQNARSNTRTGLRGMQRKHFVGSYKNTDNVVDAYFKVLRTDSSIYERRREIKDQTYKLKTVTPKMKPRKTDIETFESQPNVRNNSQREKQADQYKKPQRINTQQTRSSYIVNPVYLAHEQPRNYQMKHFSRENNPNFINVNFHKNELSIDTLRASRNNNHLAEISRFEPEDSYQTKTTSVMVGNTVPAGYVPIVRSSIMPEVKNDHTLKTGNSNHNEGEYRKRDTNPDNYYDMKAKRNALSDGLTKYTVSKSKPINVERKRGKEYSRIGIHEDSLDVGDNPYAIFYRTLPETFNGLLGDYVPLPFGTVQEHASVFTKNHNHRIATDFGHKINNMDTLPVINTRKANLPKKVKNVANHRSLYWF